MPGWPLNRKSNGLTKARLRRLPVETWVGEARDLADGGHLTERQLELLAGRACACSAVTSNHGGNGRRAGDVEREVGAPPPGAQVTRRSRSGARQGSPCVQLEIAVEAWNAPTP